MQNKKQTFMFVLIRAMVTVQNKASDPVRRVARH
tara:strand:+ start:5855 stop:5956 length:102 start_codon:yes stop_codon:yes gene_type:complete